MALKPTIYKIKIMLSDMERHCYQDLDLTVAQHPSETLERMMIRVLAFCINAQESLSFTKGLSSPDEPDIWARNLNGRLLLWVDVGEPAADRIKKATRLAETVRVYSFNSKSDVWWNQERRKFAELRAQVFRFPWEAAQAMAALVQRTMDFSVTIAGETAYLATENGNCEVPWEILQSP